MLEHISRRVDAHSIYEVACGLKANDNLSIIQSSMILAGNLAGIELHMNSSKDILTNDF